MVALSGAIRFVRRYSLSPKPNITITINIISNRSDVLQTPDVAEEGASGGWRVVHHIPNEAILSSHHLLCCFHGNNTWECKGYQ
jgi:hypothetical protein